MGTFSVVPDQPVDQENIELGYVVPKHRHMMSNEVLRERPVEAFHGAVHLWTPRIGMVVTDGKGVTGIVEEVRKLTPVVEARNLPKIAQEGNLLQKSAYRTLFGSNLFLANREARVCAPSGIDFSPKNQWAALCTAHQMAGEKPKSFVLVPSAGIEPTSFP